MSNVYENDVLRIEINKYLKNANIKKTKLAERIGCSRQSITKYLSSNSKNLIPASFILKIENALNLEANYFKGILEEHLSKNIQPDENISFDISKLSEDSFHEAFVSLGKTINAIREEIRNSVMRDVIKHLILKNYAITKTNGEYQADGKKIVHQFVHEEPHYTSRVPHKDDERKHDYIIANLASDEIRVVYHAFDLKPCVYLFDVEKCFGGVRSVPVETIDNKLYDHFGNSLEEHRIN